MKKIIFSILAGLLAAMMALFAPEAPQPRPVRAGLTVHFLDVGQADCALLECNNEFLLIDGGNVEDGQLVVSYLNQMGVDSLTVVCTHAHEDHVGGLPAVLSVFDAQAVYAPVTEYDSKVFRDFVKKTDGQGLALTVPQPGDGFPLGPASVTILGPVKDYAETNNTSLVLLISYGDSDFLFTGDMELEAENDLLDHWQEEPQAEVLKVGHHGSESSTGYRFLYNVNPDYAIISVGEGNTYGHPDEKPLSRLEDAGAAIFRTDQLGHIVARTDGADITFTWENQNAAPENVEPGEDALRLLYGNVKSGKFHVWHCPSLPGEANRITFESYDAAIAEGYSPCGGCMK